MNVNQAPDRDAIRAAELIYRKWDEALGRKDVDAALRLYAPDAVLESPLVRICSAPPKASFTAATISVASSKRSLNAHHRCDDATGMDFSPTAKDWSGNTRAKRPMARKWILSK
jgi:hypothetical protein